jgi:serine/threonine protein kinase
MNRRFQINEKIGDYRVLGFIGQGGMGEVYQFFHEKLNRSVAVKLLGGNGGLDSSYKERFLNEARLHARLQHQNIATLYDFQEVGNELLIFMELIDGECLDSLIERRFYSIEESLKIFKSILEAIVYVHSNGIIHRDIKAENVKVNSGGVPKLLDFGIAKDPGSQNLTKIGGVIGTPNYLAPEQLQGKQATEQTDIWALGVLLYKMLTGGLPFESPVFENLILQITQAKFQTVESRNSAIPKSVSNIVNKCLDKDLSQRYQTADELLSDVRKILNERYSNEKYVGKVPKDNSFFVTKVALIAGSSVILLFLMVIGLWAISGTSNESANLKPPVRTAENLKTISTPRKSEPLIAQTEKKDDLKITQIDPVQIRKIVRVDMIGGTAEVWRNGQKIGKTPLDLEIVDKEIINLQLKREGSFDTDVQLESTVGKKVYTFSMKQK